MLREEQIKRRDRHKNKRSRKKIDYIVYFIIKNMDVLSNTICYPSSAFASHSDLLFFCAN